MNISRMRKNQQNVSVKKFKNQKNLQAIKSTKNFKIKNSYMRKKYEYEIVNCKNKGNNNFNVHEIFLN